MSGVDRPVFTGDDVEAAARALYENDYVESAEWATASESAKSTYRHEAVAMLTAVAPSIAARAQEPLQAEVERLRIEVETKSVVHKCCEDAERLQRIVDGYDRTPAEARAATAEARLAAVAAVLGEWDADPDGRLSRGSAFARAIRAALSGDDR